MQKPFVNKGIAPPGDAAADAGSGGSVAANAEGTVRERDGINIVEANIFKAVLRVDKY